MRSMRLTILASGLIAGWFTEPAPSADDVDPRKPAPLPAAVPAPNDNPATPEKVALGKLLFFDPRLSGDNSMSCATCHVPEKGWADGLPGGKGWKGKKLGRNTPTVLDVAFFGTVLWDGRAKTLEEQALRPINSPEEMHQSLDELERELNAVPGYVKQFRSVFGMPVTRDGIAKALAAFERTLIARNSPYDRYLAGDEQALSADAKAGMELFFGAADCARCHHGPLLSDGKFYRLGVEFQDKGRGGVTGKSEDLYKFRTPSLRNVARTAPYMHDGSRKTLTEVVEFYFRTAPSRGLDGLPLDIEPLVGQSYSDIAPLVAFLESLSGEPPAIEPPELP